MSTSQGGGRRGNTLPPHMPGDSEWFCLLVSIYYKHMEEIMALKGSSNLIMPGVYYAAKPRSHVANRLARAFYGFFVKPMVTLEGVLAQSSCSLAHEVTLQSGFLAKVPGI